jgi:hypothetical protein
MDRERPTKLAGDANIDITKTIIECVRERVTRGAHSWSRSKNTEENP